MATSRARPALECWFRADCVSTEGADAAMDAAANVLARASPATAGMLEEGVGLMACAAAACSDHACACCVGCGGYARLAAQIWRTMAEYCRMNWLVWHALHGQRKAGILAPVQSGADAGHQACTPSAPGLGSGAEQPKLSCKPSDTLKR